MQEGNVARHLVAYLQKNLATMCDINLSLIKTIERFPCLYNYKSSDYCKKEITEKAWAEVAKENLLTVAECKEKWKNLRYGFIRSLRPNIDGSSKKMYYLHKDMEFVLPFVKVSRKNSNHVSQLNGDSDDENIDIVVTENGQPQHVLDFEMVHNSIPTKRVRYQERVTNDDSRKMFLLSLVPEVNELTNNQMKTFKRKVLALLDEIVETPNAYDTNIIQWHTRVHSTEGYDSVDTQSIKSEKQ